jgi:uncharacterized repeat protein (TIGR03803 family)
MIHDANAATETVLYSFCNQRNCPDGEVPEDGVIDVNGMLYGTTLLGGKGLAGTLFALDPMTGTETVLHSFYAAGGDDPLAGLIDIGRMLYGSAGFGGPHNDGGALFAFDLTSGAEKVLHSFGSGTDGAVPGASLIHVKDTLYGTTESGGTSGYGTVFALDRKTRAETVLYSFCSQDDCTDGAFPAAALVDVHGILYGTTEYGGANCAADFGCGTVFALDPATGVETVLYSFQGNSSDGANPEAGLTEVKGTLYGTTYTGGNCRDVTCGTVFSLDPSNGTEAGLHFFGQGSDGRDPSAGLIAIRDTLYGTTYYGGAQDEGAVFALDRRTGAEQVLYSFGSYKGDGRFPGAGLIDVSGTFYGTTESGGTGCDDDCGTVFSIRIR